MYVTVHNQIFLEKEQNSSFSIRKEVKYNLSKITKKIVVCSIQENPLN